MDIILWRHADAEDGADDLARRLTAKGEAQAAAMAKWLRRHLPADYVVLASPARASARPVRRPTRVDGPGLPSRPYEGSYPNEPVPNLSGPGGGAAAARAGRGAGGY